MIDTVLFLMLIGVFFGLIEILVRTIVVVAPRVYAKVVGMARQISMLLFATTTGAIAVTIVTLLILFVAPISQPTKKRKGPVPGIAPAIAPTAARATLPATASATKFPAFAWAKVVPSSLPFPNPWNRSRVGRGATPGRAIGAKQS